jgi:hypothetical protein
MMDLPPPDPGIEIVVASRGMSKGLAQTDGFQVLGRGELLFGDLGFSAYYKNITSATADGEVGVGAILKKKLGGFDVSGTVTFKWLTGLDGQVDPDSIELIPSVSRRFGPMTARVSVTYTPNDFGRTGSSTWIEGGLAWKVGKSTTISGNLGRRERERAVDYTGFNLGVSHSLHKNFTAELRYYDTHRSALGDNFHGRAVAILRAKF